LIPGLLQSQKSSSVDQMSKHEGWIPLRWPREWEDPALLELLEGTPVNCLVTEGAPPPKVAGKARAAGLQLFDSQRQDGVLWTERAKAQWSSPAPVVALTDVVWPGVPVAREGGAADAGPTGLPWVDSNGWKIQLARALGPAKTIWIAAEAPAQAGIVLPAAYLLAVADAAAYGARWAIWLDNELRAGLAHKSGAALRTWRDMAGALRYFEERRAWKTLEPLGTVAVVSDFTGPNEFMSTEILNLLPRRGLPYRVVEKAGAAQALFDGLAAVIYPDREPPGAGLRASLEAFVRQGGLLVANAGYPAPPGAPAPADVHRRFRVRRVGKGRIALPTGELEDPYLVAADTHLLASHRHDPVRLFNTGTLNVHLTGAPDGRRALLQAINFAMRPSGNPVSAAFRRRYRAAHISTLEAPRPAPLELHPTESGGVEAHLPRFAVYAAIELEA
jgi:hypothetical protein